MCQACMRAIELPRGLASHGEPAAHALGVWASDQELELLLLALCVSITKQKQIARQSSCGEVGIPLFVTTRLDRVNLHLPKRHRTLDFLRPRQLCNCHTRNPTQTGAEKGVFSGRICEHENYCLSSWPWADFQRLVLLSCERATTYT
jgi:hypothetical protein